MSLTYNKKRNGPRTDPWGIPLLTLALFEMYGPIWVDCIRLFKDEENQSLVIPL